MIFVIYGPGHPGHQFREAVAEEPALVAAEGALVAAADAVVGAAVGAAEAVLELLAGVLACVDWVAAAGELELHAVVSDPAKVTSATPLRNPRRLTLAMSIYLHLSP